MVLASIVVDCGFEPRSDQSKDCEIGTCCFSAKHAALRIKSKDESRFRVRVGRHVYPLTISTKCVGLDQSGPYHHLIEN